MSEKYNPEFIRALAHGDQEAEEQIKQLSSAEKISVGLAVEEMRRNENIVPMTNGMSLYVQKKSSYVDDEAVGKFISDRLQHEKDLEAKKIKDREVFLEKIAKEEIARARAGLTRNDR